MTDTVVERLAQTQMLLGCENLSDCPTEPRVELTNANLRVSEEQLSVLLRNEERGTRKSFVETSEPRGERTSETPNLGS